LTALNPGTSDRYNGVVAVERGALSNNVMRGCMAEKGYVLVREEEVSAKSAEYAAASAQQARQDAAVQSPASSAKRVRTLGRPPFRLGFRSRKQCPAWRDVALALTLFLFCSIYTSLEAPQFLVRITK
jgi:hypothetical protein